jgi:TRAP-type C4-dicarboxylate transport system permease small subunit
LKLLRRFDAGLARGEGAIAAVVLLLLILVAAAQALLRNLTLVHVGWANTLLEHLSWGDSFMQKSTLWLAFLGASLATHNEKHIAIDVLSRISPKRAQMLLAVIVGLFSAVTCFYLARVFFQGVMNNAGDVPFDMQVMDEAGASLHICDAAQAALADARLTRPDLFCGVRSSLEAIGAHVSTPDTALQLIAPAMFLVMSARFVLHSVLSGMRFTGRDVGDEVTVASEEMVPPSGAEAPEPADSESSESTDDGDDGDGD